MIELRKYIIEVPAKLNIEKSTTNIQIVLLEALPHGSTLNLANNINNIAGASKLSRKLSQLNAHHSHYIFNSFYEGAFINFYVVLTATVHSLHRINLITNPSFYIKILYSYCCNLLIQLYHMWLRYKIQVYTTLILSISLLILF